MIRIIKGLAASNVITGLIKGKDVSPAAGNSKIMLSSNTHYQCRYNK